jgi:predicted nucleotidyltransferase
MERLLNQLVERLTKAYGDRLKSVILYGSGASGDHHAKYSDLNVLCVLKQVSVGELEDSNAIVRWWREQGNPSPLMLSEEELRSSTDCFAIEYADIKERRRVLYGEDLAIDLQIDTCFYRAQVEHDLRAKLLRLRQRAAGVLNDAGLLRELLADSVSTFCVLFRHALLLDGVEAKFGKREIVAQTRDRFGVDAGPFEQLLSLREGKIKPKEIEPRALLEAYLRELGKVIEAVDRLDK